VWSSGGGGGCRARAMLCDEEVGKGPGPTGWQQSTGNGPAAALTGGARSARQGPETLTRGPEATVIGGTRI
jgi:hypothetical protein